MRILFDAVNASAIPPDAELVAGYVDGPRSQWSASDWARFPNATLVHIAVLPTTNDGVVLDVETGDATPAEAPPWVTMRRQAGVDPTVYCGVDAWTEVWNQFVAQGVAQPHYWLCDLSFGPVSNRILQPEYGVVARQLLFGSGFDVSGAADYWPGVDPPQNVTLPPAPAPPPVITPIVHDETPLERAMRLAAAAARAAGGSL